MNSIIKSGTLDDTAPIRPLAALAASRAEPVLSHQELELIASRQRIAALEQELRERDRKIEDLRADVNRAYEEGKSAGHSAGLAEAEDRQAERISLLERAVGDAQMQLSEGLASMERLSGILARECLDIILGDAKSRADIVKSIISAQIVRLDKAMVLSIDLSLEDFPDSAALKDVADNAGLPSAVLMARPELSSGACIFNLKLGRMDASIDRQWSVLREVLGEIAASGEAG